MPNHVSSKIMITGPVADVRRFVSLVDRSNDTSEKAFDFSGVVPMPDELDDVMIQTDWALTNWGTKWGAYDATEWDVTEGENGNATATISYNTAWSPATAFYINASEKYPTLAFDTQYADEGGGFVRETSYANGEITKDIDYDWDSAEGIEVREAVGYGPFPDEDEDKYETEEDTDEQTMKE